LSLTLGNQASVRQGRYFLMLKTLQLMQEKSSRALLFEQMFDKAENA